MSLPFLSFVTLTPSPPAAQNMAKDKRKLVHICLGMINKMELDLAPSRPSCSGMQTSILQLTLTASLDSC